MFVNITPELAARELLRRSALRKLTGDAVSVGVKSVGGSMRIVLVVDGVDYSVEVVEPFSASDVVEALSQLSASLRDHA